MVQEVFDLKDQNSKLSCNIHQHIGISYECIYIVILNHFLFSFYFSFIWQFQVAYRNHSQVNQVDPFSGTAINDLICEEVLLLSLAQDK